MKLPCLSIGLLATLLVSSSAWSSQSISQTSRRGVLSTFGLLTTFSTQQAPTFAAGAGPTPDELARIQKGYKAINYLLNNFEQETTVCRESGTAGTAGECKRDANRIREVLGLRSTTDPLFQIDKVFNKVKNLDLDPDDLDKFFEATEEWQSAMAMSNSMAFISQFGEYNPGGGQDEVLKYLKESQKQVIIARDALKKIMEALKLPTD